MDRLVTIKSNRYGMELRMNPDVPFEEIQKAVVEMPGWRSALREGL